MQREIKTTGGECAATLSGFLFCDVCGRQMTVKSTYRGDKIYRYYNCRDCERAGRSTVRISEKKATAELLRAIRHMALSVSDIEHFEFSPEDSGEVKCLDMELLSLQEEMDRCERLKNRLFGDYSAGILTRSEYMDYSKLYLDKIERVKKESKAVSERRSRLVSEIADASWLGTFRKYRDIDALQRKVMCELVDKVYVSRGGKMDIRFRHDNAIKARKEAAKYEEPGLEAAI